MAKKPAKKPAKKTGDDIHTLSVQIVQYDKERHRVFIKGFGTVDQVCLSFADDEVADAVADACSEWAEADRKG